MKKVYIKPETTAIGIQLDGSCLAAVSTLFFKADNTRGNATLIIEEEVDDETKDFEVW